MVVNFSMRDSGMANRGVSGPSAFTVSGNRNANFIAHYFFPQFLHILFDVPALKNVMDRGCIESLKVYISFPINALDILP